ncbi:MAG TPA: hypothetical protein VL549_04470 [Gemmatimonadales bacterium]|nr:hypothetical protein [Gemmatimonadales bacterium]
MAIPKAGLAAIVVIALVGGCSKPNPERAKLDRGMAFARRQLGEASRNPMANMALGNTAELGGGFATYLAANMPDNANLPRYQDNAPSGPWSIALVAYGDDKVIIDGYGDSLDAPIVAETVSVRFTPRRAP